MNRAAFTFSAIIVAILLSYALHQALDVAPTEATMGNVQRIFYYHVPSAWTAFILFFVAIVFHIYLGTIGEPGTFRSMTRGTVTRAWARLHHPRWFREVTGEQPRR